MKSKAPGRPRLHEVGKWSAVRLRLPIALRQRIYDLLTEKNDKLAYRLSLNSLLLELIESALKEPKVAPPAENSEEHSKKILMNTPSSLGSK